MQRDVIPSSILQKGLDLLHARYRFTELLYYKPSVASAMKWKERFIGSTASSKCLESRAALILGFIYFKVP